MLFKYLLSALFIISILILITTNPTMQPFPDGTKVDKVLVRKSDKRLDLIKNGEVLKSYPVVFGGNPVGHKVQEGDQRTPEGNYIIDWRNENSRFYLSLHVSYPNPTDTKKAEELGVNPGGLIMIHGMRNGFGWIGKLHRFFNWTEGCIAVTNREMDEIWRAVNDGTEIEIRP